MPALASRTVSLPSPDIAKMDEKKRAAMLDRHESEPPSKKQATAVNGPNKPHVDADMPWRDDLERFQKDAIWRQMQEYKRERLDAETRLQAAATRAKYHDEHIAVIDAWFVQLLDEIKILTGDGEPDTFQPFPSRLLTADSSIFQRHLQDRSAMVTATVTQILARKSAPLPDMHALQARLTEALAAEKDHLIRLEKNGLEIARLQERLEDAALRYMVAEKKLDRSKSAAVAKMEKQAKTETTNGAKPAVEEPQKETHSDGALEKELQLAKQAASLAAVESSKLKSQLQELEAYNKTMQTELTDLRVRLSRLTDEDFSKCDLYKELKSQNEDVIKRINDLQARNVELREEAQKLQTERMAYRTEVEADAAQRVTEREAHLAETESNLTRVRLNRDDLQADVALRKSQQESEKSASAAMKSLAEAKEDRIVALESELARLQAEKSTAADEVAQLDAEELRSRYASLEKQHRMLNSELASMGSAYKKASSLASHKVAGLASLEDRVHRLQAEKHKAEQKYFSTMKTKEARELEMRSMRLQNGKSSDTITALKETEAALRALQVNLEQQTVEAKESVLNLQAKLRMEQQQISEKNIQLDGLKGQVEQLKQDATNRDETVASSLSSKRVAELEAETLRQRVESLQSDVEGWRKRGAEAHSEEFEMLRQLALCTVCRKNFKNTAIKTCGHVFCKDCVEERTTSRMRKCPNCNRAFGAGDVMRVTL